MTIHHCYSMVVRIRELRAAVGTCAHVPAPAVCLVSAAGTAGGAAHRGLHAGRSVRCCNLFVATFSLKFGEDQLLHSAAPACAVLLHDPPSAGSWNEVLLINLHHHFSGSRRTRSQPPSTCVFTAARRWWAPPGSASARCASSTTSRANFPQSSCSSWPTCERLHVLFASCHSLSCPHCRLLNASSTTGHAIPCWAAARPNQPASLCPCNYDTKTMRSCTNPINIDLRRGQRGREATPAATPVRN